MSLEATETIPARQKYSPIHVEKSDQALRCRVVEAAADFAALELEWRELSLDCRWPSLFQSWEWASTWWRYFGEEPGDPAASRGLYVIVVEDCVTRQILGILPLHYKRKVSGWSLKPRRLEAFGELGLEDALGDEPILLLRRGHEQAALQEALRHLFTASCPITWDFLSLKLACQPGGLFLDGPPNREIKRHSGQYWKQLSYPGRMVTRLGSDWERYRRSLSKSMRDNTAYYPKRLLKHGRAATMEYVTDPDALAPVVNLLIDLHTRRALDRRGFRHANHLSGDSQRGMLQEILRALAAQDKAFIALLRIDGEPAAVQAFLRREGAIVFYFSGHDPAFAEYSPLTLLTMDVLKTAMSEDCREIDFLPGKVPWKERWGATAEYDVEEIFCVSGTLRSRLLANGRRIFSSAMSRLRPN